jgi:hypothetical protein
VHVARGAVRANDVALEAGDALKLAETAALTLQEGRDAEVLVFDLPGAVPALKAAAASTSAAT